MNSTLSNSWLSVCAGAAAVICGVHPSILSYLILVMGFLMIFIWRDEDNKFVQPNLTTKIIFLFVFVYAAVALKWSILPARGFYDLCVMALMVWVGMQTTAGMLTLGHGQAEKQLRIALIGFLIGLLCFAADLYFDLIVQRALRNAPWNAPLHLAVTTRACFCLVLLFWPLAAYIWQRGWRASAILLWLLLGILTVFSDTAAGRLAFAVSTLAFITAKISPQFMRMIFSAVIVAGFIVAVPVARHIQDAIGEQAGRMSGSFGQRTEIWTFAAKRILEKPIFGWGFDSARAIPNFGEVSVYQGNDPSKSIIPMHTHNWFLHVWLELGGVGAAMIGAFWVWLIWRTEKFARAVQPAALAAISVIFCIGAFSIGIWQTWWWAAVIFALWMIAWLERAQSDT